MQDRAKRSGGKESGEGFALRLAFETEAQENSEMAYCVYASAPTKACEQATLAAIRVSRTIFKFKQISSGFHTVVLLSCQNDTRGNITKYQTRPSAFA